MDRHLLLHRSSPLARALGLSVVVVEAIPCYLWLDTNSIGK